MKIDISKLWHSLTGGIFLIGLGILFYLDVFWPGILILLGIVMIMGGVGASVWGIPCKSEKEKLSHREGMLVGGMIVLFVGLALFTGFYWTLGVGPWMIGALVPAFIGLALLIASRMIKSKKK